MDSHKIIVIVVAIIAIVGLSFLFGVSKTDTYEDGDLAGEAFRFRSNDNSEGKTLGQNLVQAKTELGEVPKFPVEAEFYVERKSDAFIEFGSDVIYYPYYEVNWKLSSGLPLEATVAAVKIKNFLGEDLDAHGVSKTCSTDNKVCEGKFIIQMGSNYAPHTSANIEPFPKGEDKPSYLSYAEAFDKCYYDTEFVSGLEPDDLFEACAGYLSDVGASDEICYLAPNYEMKNVSSKLVSVVTDYDQGSCSDMEIVFAVAVKDVPQPISVTLSDWNNFRIKYSDFLNDEVDLESYDEHLAGLDTKLNKWEGNCYCDGAYEITPLETNPNVGIIFPTEGPIGATQGTTVIPAEDTPVPGSDGGNCEDCLPDVCYYRTFGEDGSITFTPQ